MIGRTRRAEEQPPLLIQIDDTPVIDITGRANEEQPPVLIPIPAIYPPLPAPIDPFSWGTIDNPTNTVLRPVTPGQPPRGRFSQRVRDNRKANTNRLLGNDPLIEAEENDLIAPMIEMPNPNAGDQDTNPTVWVYRAWTINDVKSVTADIPHPKDGPEDCIAKLRLMADSFRPNAAEFETCVREVLGIEWYQGADTWTAIGQNGRPLNYSQDNTSEYWTRIDALIGRIQQHFRGHADFSKIADCMQKEKETIQEYLERLRKIFKVHSGMTEPPVWEDEGPYAMQLKNAFMGGMRTEISTFIKKHLIQWQKNGFNPVKQMAAHAESFILEKEKKMVNKFEIHEVQTDRETTRRGQSNRRKGGGRRGGNKGNRRSENWENYCYVCGKDGHWAKDCHNRAQRERHDNRVNWERDDNRVPREREDRRQ